MGSSTFAGHRGIAAVVFLGAVTAVVTSNLVSGWNVPYMPLRYGLDQLGRLAGAGYIIALFVRDRSDRFAVTVFGAAVVLFLSRSLLEFEVTRNMVASVAGLFESQVHRVVETSLTDAATGFVMLALASLVITSSQKKAGAIEGQRLLRATEERFRQLVETTKAVPWEAEVDTLRFTYVGPQVADLLGFPPESWYGEHFWEEHIHPDDREQTIRFCQAATARGEDHEFDYRMIAADGRTVWVHDLISVARRENGCKTVRGFMIDVTERKRAERELQTLAHALRSIGECVVITDIEDNVLFVNDAFLRTYGYEEREIVGERVGVVYSQDNPPEVIDAIVPATLRDGWQGELLGRRKDGRDFPITVATSVVHDEFGQPLALAIAITDITERKRAEQALRDSETMFRTLAETIPAAIYLHQGGKFTYANAAAVEAYGYSREELLSMNFWELAHPDFAQEIKARGMARVQGEQVPRRFEVKNITKDGRECWRDVVASSIVIGDKRSCLITSIDITERKRAEEALRASEQRYRTFVERSAEGIYCIECREPVPVDASEDEQIERWLRHGYVAECNDAHARMYGLSHAAEFVGTPVREVVVASDPNNVEAWRSCIRAGYRINDLETHEVDKDGRSKYFLNNMVGIAENGRWIRLWGTQRDVTERKRAEESLRQSEERFRKVFEDGPLGMALVGPDYRTIDVNGEMCRMLGYTREELLRLTFTDFTHPDDLEEDLNRAAMVFRGEIPHYKTQKRFIKKNQEIVWTNLTASAIRDENGEALYGIGMIEDITERKLAEDALQRAYDELEDRVSERTAALAEVNESLRKEIAERKEIEKALRESERRYRAFIEHSAEGIYCVEYDEPIPLDESVEEQIDRSFRHGYVAECNDAQAQMYGFSTANEFVGTRLRNIHIRSDPQNIEVMRQSIRSGYRLTDVETHEVDKEGRSKYFLNNFIGIVENGAVVRVWGTQRDISEQKRMADALRESEKLAATGRMAARIAHEINNPLGGIKNSFALVKGAIPESHPHFAYVSRIEKEIDRIAAIVRQMYHLYRPDQESAREFDIDQAVRDVAALLQASCRDYDLGLNVDLPGEPLVASLPEGSVRQVLFNVIQNAIDASPPGSAVSILATANGERVSISVTDQGSGIADEVGSKIFEPFFTTKVGRPNEGLGLGLSISRSLAEAMGGSLDFKSDPENGTCFRIVLPRHG